MSTCVILSPYYSFSAQWQRVRAVQLFAEHIITKHYSIGLETYGKRLDFVNTFSHCVLLLLTLCSGSRHWM